MCLILHLQTPREVGGSGGGFRAGSRWDACGIEDHVARQTCCFVSIRDGFLLLQPPWPPPYPQGQRLGTRKGLCPLGRGGRAPCARRCPPGSRLGSWRGDGNAVWSVLCCQDPVALLADAGHLRAGTRHALHPSLAPQSPQPLPSRPRPRWTPSDSRGNTRGALRHLLSPSAPRVPVGSGMKVLSARPSSWA